MQLQESTVGKQTTEDGMVYPGGENQVEVLKQNNNPIVNDVFLIRSQRPRWECR